MIKLITIIFLIYLTFFSISGHEMDLAYIKQLTYPSTPPTSIFR